MELLSNNSWVLGIVVYVGVILVVFWVAMVIWAYRDMRARSRDVLAQLFVGLLVAVLNVPGLFIYILLRPRETLSEAYERSLEEEALLQEIEEKPTCPGCGQRVHDDWQACAYCHTRLKKPCYHCTELLELSWNLCPYCATDQTRYEPEAQVVAASRHVHRVAPAPEPLPDFDDKWFVQGNPSNPPEYVDDEY